MNDLRLRKGILMRTDDAHTEDMTTASDALGEVERRLRQRKGYHAEDVIRFALQHIEAWRKGVARVSPRDDTESETVSGVLELTEEQAMDLWWEACDDTWAVPDDLPAKFLRHVVCHISERQQ